MGKREKTFGFVTTLEEKEERRFLRKCDQF